MLIAKYVTWLLRAVLILEEILIKQQDGKDLSLHIPQGNGTCTNAISTDYQAISFSHGVTVYLYKGLYKHIFRFYWAISISLNLGPFSDDIYIFKYILNIFHEESTILQMKSKHSYIFYFFLKKKKL